MTGRLLVGLRWHNRIDENGKSSWQFDSYEEQRFVHSLDSNVFWVGLFLAPVIWTVLAMGTVITLRFMWMLLVIVALALTGINAYGYVKCKRDAGRKLSAIGGSVLTRGFEIWSGAQAKMPSGFTGAAASGSGSRVPVPTEEHV